MNENIRQDLIKTILTLDDENVLAVREYIEFISNVQEDEPTSHDLQAILKGRQEFANGEYVTWEKPQPDGL